MVIYDLTIEIIFTVDFYSYPSEYFPEQPLECTLSHLPRAPLSEIIPYKTCLKIGTVSYSVAYVF